MANLNQKIPIQASPSIVSYNYTDISDGTGVIVFNGASHREASTTALYLTTATPYSSSVVVSGSAVPGTATAQVLSANFDIIFNRPQRIKGQAYLNVTFGGTGNAGTGTPTIFISGGSLQNSTTSETMASIGNLNNQGIDLSFPSEGTYSKQLNIELDMTGTTYHIKQDDVLRLNVQVWGTTTGSRAISYGGIGADPADRNDPDGLTIADADTTQMVLYLPFMVDVGQ